MGESFKLEKRQGLRNNEYYGMQSIFDDLYSQSKENKKFTDLMQYITMEQNINLALRNIKSNKGAYTPGSNGKNISNIKMMNSNNYHHYFKRKFQNYSPKSVKRIEIPKPGSDKKRPLGIPCIEDRIIQQSILQILEPILEAKFHKHSYGFRPNRSTSHAVGRCMRLINNYKLYYVVDIDIKGFFDNVDHGKLKRQLWRLGIQDKNLISMLGKILKSEIQGIGIPMRGTPQGGIISPLLSNVVLNELDWWISSQWETFKTKLSYSSNGNKYRHLKRSNLKEMYIVRYVDDFKIFCRDYKTAQKIYNATRLWLKERLGLDISTEKSQVTNLKKNYSDFLGFKLTAKLKGKKYTCRSHMSDKAIKNTICKLKTQIDKINKNTTTSEVNKLNSMILGSHNYYRYATLVSEDFRNINFLILRTLKKKLNNRVTHKPLKSKLFNKLYGEYKGKPYTVAKVTIFPIYGCRTQIAYAFNQDICNYTETGRQLIHNNIRGSCNLLIKYLLNNMDSKESMEYHDNSISLMAAQRGTCYITGLMLSPWEMKCHRKKPKELGGTDEYSNLAWVSKEAHNLVYANDDKVIEKYTSRLNLDEKGLKRVNSLRKLVGKSVI